METGEAVWGQPTLEVRATFGGRIAQLCPSLGEPAPTAMPDVSWRQPSVSL